MITFSTTTMMTKMMTTTKILMMRQHVVMLLMMTMQLNLKIRKGMLETLMMPTWLDSIISFSWSAHSVMMKSKVTTRFVACRRR